jgi:hypothetical protein
MAILSSGLARTERGGCAGITYACTYGTDMSPYRPWHPRRRLYTSVSTNCSYFIIYANGLFSHVVENNDSCGSIQTTYGLNSTILMLNNPQIESDCSNIYTGEVLCVAQTVIAPPIPQGFFDGSDEDTIEWIPVPDDGSDENEDLPYCDEVMP